MGSSDEESDWDEVEIPQPPSIYVQPPTIDIALAEAESHHLLEHDIEITLTRTGGTSKQQQEEASAQRLVAAQNRLVRLESHKLHAVALLASLSIRNKWLNDRILKARLLSLIPLPIQHAFASVNKSAHPDPARRGRLFETAVSRLVDWFAPSSPATHNSYVGRKEGWFHVRSSGHIRSHTFESGLFRTQLLEKREAERNIRRAKREERRAKRVRARTKGKGKARDLSSSSSDEDDGIEDDETSEWYAPEPLRSANSIAKHALQRSGTRDMATLIFVAIMRALGLPARLVGSLQCVAWGPHKYHSDKKRKAEKVAKAAASLTSNQNTEDDIDMDEVIIPAMPSPRIGSPASVAERGALSVGTPQRRQLTGDMSDGSSTFKNGTKRKRSSLAGLRDDRARKASGSDKGGGNSVEPTTESYRDTNSIPSVSPTPHVVKLRRARPTGNVLGAAPATLWESHANAKEVVVGGPPTLWAEVFSRPDCRWLPVDPIRGIVNRANVFEERHTSGQKRLNKLVYVVAMEEDGYARDVTARYAKNYSTQMAKARARVAAGGRNGKVEWWDSVMRSLRRPYALHRDDVEDAELSHQRALEGLPSSISGFKNHPIYALERHLRKDEAIYPRTEIAHFRGEPVFSRQNVLSLKPADGWMRQGRVLRPGVQPIKKSKARASTIRKKRELEMRREDEGEEVMVGMYAHWQTDLYTPPPVVDGRIPTNDFGNIDLYVPTMLPAGAVHVPHKGCAKVARKLGIHFAEAVTGFEFRKRQATPIITGIVIAAENERSFLEALATHTRAQELKEAAKQRERVLRRWSRLVQGLRIVRRLNEQYSAAKGAPAVSVDADVNTGGMESQEPGGFLDDLRDVVKPYNLPEAQHLVPQPRANDDNGDRVSTASAPVPRELLLEQEASTAAYIDSSKVWGGNKELEPGDILNQASEYTQHLGPPLTMQQLADQQSKPQIKANSGRSSPSNDETVAPPVNSPEQVQTQAEEPIARTRPADDAGERMIEKDQDNVKHIDNKAGRTRATRSSQRQRNVPPESTGGSNSTSTRTLRSQGRR